MPVDEMLGLPEIREKDRPYVRFETKTIEDKKASREQERIVFKDVHYALVTPPGSKDIQIEEVSRWWPKLHEQVQTGRLPGHWVEQWKAAFKRYEQGLELPTDGTPIRGWNLVPGSVQETLCRANILTVEALANATDEALANIGMGGLEFKRRAKAWVEQHADKSGLAIKMAAAQQELDVLKTTVASLEEKNKELLKRLDAKSKKD